MRVCETTLLLHGRPHREIEGCLTHLRAGSACWHKLMHKGEKHIKRLCEIAIALDQCQAQRIWSGWQWMSSKCQKLDNLWIRMTKIKDRTIVNAAWEPISIQLKKEGHITRCQATSWKVRGVSAHWLLLKCNSITKPLSKHLRIDHADQFFPTHLTFKCNPT